MSTEHIAHPITLNSDLSQRCIVHSPSLAWVDSPASGVSRRMRERDGGEQMLERRELVVAFVGELERPMERGLQAF